MVTWAEGVLSQILVARMASSHLYCLVTTAYIQGRAVLGDPQRGYGQGLPLRFPPRLGELAGQAGLALHFAGGMSSLPSRASLEMETHSRDGSHGNGPAPPPEPSLSTICGCPQSLNPPSLA